MADWSKSMQQSFEYYTVDPNTWKDMKLLNTVKSCSINRDSEQDTLGSATIDINDSVGECYIRVYLITVQNGVTEKHPLGTFLVQTPSSSYDGKTRSVSMDAYTPLLELKEKQPPLGYYVPKSVYKKVDKGETTYTATSEVLSFPESTTHVPTNVTTTTGQTVYVKDMPTGGDLYYCQINAVWYKVTRKTEYAITDEEMTSVIGTALEGETTATGEQIFVQTTGGMETYYCLAETIMDLAYRLVRENVRAPVVPTECVTPLHYDFVAEPDDTWFTYLKDLITNANCEFALDELGRVLFSPKQDTASLQPVWTYTDDNSSILYPEMTMNHDLYGIPNVVEVVYSTGNDILYATVKNEDPNSPTSIPNRGREIILRVTDPELVGVPTQAQIDDYADRLLREASSVEYTITYSHGYCPVRIGDCVRLNYNRAGIKNIKAKVISQSIKCEAGCKVTEKAVFTTKLWR